MKLTKITASPVTLWVVLVISFCVLSLVGQRARAEGNKSMPADVGDGRVAWFDITTTNLAQSKDFYGKLFGWTFASVQGSDQAAEISAGGKGIGTIRVADGKISPFNGVVYIQVSDVPASCAKAKQLGATIAPGFPFNLPNGTGAISLLLDPAAHPMGLYARKSLPVPAVPTK
ncbi:MAG: VOC family protein [Chthoniobacterales bacterium]|nr:VOC family protein [Chthoniobacterales bacterium]